MEKLEVLLMPNGEILLAGIVVGVFSTHSKYLSEKNLR